MQFLKQSGHSDISLVGIDNAAVWATFAAAVAKTPVHLDAKLGDFRGEDEDYIKRFFVPGHSAGGRLECGFVVDR